MISGFFDSDGRPTMRGMLIIPELEVWDGVDFLVDTGADMTCLHSPDIEQLRIDRGLLRSTGGPTAIRGVGGGQDYFVTRARVAFLDEPDLDRLAVFTIDLYIADSTGAGVHTPSLLGRDILDQVMMIYEPRRQRLELHHD